MPTKVDLPSKLLEVSEKPILPSDSEELVLLQPKYDGCQAILIPGELVGLPEDYVAVTRKGQLIPRLTSLCDSLREGMKYVFFCEYEPVPWSEQNKVKLAGNLYTDAELSFETRLVVFDCCTMEEFLADEHRRGSCRERVERMEEIRPLLTDTAIPVEFAPYAEMPYREAKALCESSNQETEDGTRCEVLGVWCEGGVIRYGSKAEKVKAKVDQDVAVLAAVQSAKGQRGWVVVDTKNPDDIFPVFGGVPQDFKEHVDTVVEVVKLVVTGFKGAGNPTFQRSRANEKDFDTATFRQENEARIAEVMAQYKVTAA